MTKVEEIKLQAVQLMAEKGFEAMSLRQLAAAVGLQCGSLYSHYKSKTQLLFEVCCDYLDDLMSEWMEQHKLCLRNPEDMLLNFAAVYVRFFYARAAESRILHLDYRSLNPEGKAAVQELREQYESELEGILRQGMDAGVFHLTDLHSTRLAILSLLQGFCAAGCSADPTSESRTFDACAMAILRLVGPFGRARSLEDGARVYPGRLAIKGGAAATVVSRAS